MDKFPQWLPKAVRLHTEALIHKGGLNSLKALLLRLTSDTEMEKVWAKLSTKSNDPQKLIDFLEYVRLHPTLLGKNTDPITVPSDKEQQQAFQQLSTLSKRMVRELHDLSSEAKAHSGWTFLMIALKRAELDLSEQASKNASSKAALLNILNIETRLKEIERHESIISIIELIGSAADCASTAPDALLPKKRNSDNAKRNQLILDLKHYMKHHFGTESAALIAAIVNTAFEPFEDGGVTEDSVRKLNP